MEDTSTHYLPEEPEIPNDPNRSCVTDTKDNNAVVQISNSSYMERKIDSAIQDISNNYVDGKVENVVQDISNSYVDRKIDNTIQDISNSYVGRKMDNNVQDISNSYVGMNHDIPISIPELPNTSYVDTDHSIVTEISESNYISTNDAVPVTQVSETNYIDRNDTVPVSELSESNYIHRNDTVPVTQISTSNYVDGDTIVSQIPNNDCTETNAVTTVPAIHPGSVHIQSLEQIECSSIQLLPLIQEHSEPTSTATDNENYSTVFINPSASEIVEPEIVEDQLGCCANCGIDFEVKDDQITTIYVEDDSQNISIQLALKYVFELRGSENISPKKSVFDKGGSDSSAFCLKCSLSLSMLYRALRHFWQLCALDSLVSKQLKLLFKKHESRTGRNAKQNDKGEGGVYEYPLHVKIEVEDGMEELEEDFIDDSYQDFGTEGQSDFEDSENSDNNGENLIKEERPQRKSAKRFYSTLNEILEDNKSDESSESFYSEDDDFDPNSDGDDNEDLEQNTEEEVDSNLDDEDADSNFIVPSRRPKAKKRRKQRKPQKLPKRIKKEEVYEFACTQCSRSFITSKALKRHERIHIPEIAAKLTCVQCSKTFSRSEHLVRHRVKVHGDVIPKKEFREKREAMSKQYTCPVCKMDFHLQYHEFKLHVSEHGMENPFTCSECPKAFSSLQQLKTHAKNHNPERPNYFCQVCNARFGRSYHLTRHQKNKHRVPNNISIDSQEIFDLLSSSDANADGSHICGICFKIFTRKDKLTTHVLKHTQEAPFSCITCNKKFFSERGLENHKVVHSDNPFRCELCKKIFSRVDHLKKHIETHENKKVKPEKSFSCETCGKEFKTNSNLKMHRYCHSTEKPFTCQICNKSFNHPSILSLHAKVHSDERPYCCSICGRTFKLNHHLRDHEAMHADNVPRPYKCEICQKTFKSVKHVRSHAKVHSDAKDHICSECGKAFSRIDNLRAHVRGVHLNDPAVKRRKKPQLNNATHQIPSAGFHSQIAPPPPVLPTPLLHHEVQHGPSYTYLTPFTHPHININYEYKS